MHVLTYAKVCDLLDKGPSKNSPCLAWTVSLAWTKIDKHIDRPLDRVLDRTRLDSQEKIKIWISLQIK